MDGEWKERWKWGTSYLVCLLCNSIPYQIEISCLSVVILDLSFGGWKTPNFRGAVAFADRILL